MMFALMLGYFAAPLPAQVVKVRDFNISSTRDRRSLFSAAMTPSGEVLSFIAKDSGEWQLYRVRNWLDAASSEEELILPGFFSKQDRQDLETLSAQVFVTTDGAHAVCVGSAEWLKRVRGRAAGKAKSDDVISVVDLKTFKVVSSTRTRELGLLEFHGVRLDGEGRVLVQSLSSEPRTGAFIQLDIPSLRARPTCSYNWTVDSSYKEHPITITGNECHDALKSLTLEQYLQESQAESADRSPACDNNNAEFCRLAREWTADGKFGIGSYSSGHDNFWGSWVTTESKYVIFSTAKREEVGEIKLPTNESVRKLQTSVEGRNYILLLYGGIRLSVYELQD